MSNKNKKIILSLFTLSIMALPVFASAQLGFPLGQDPPGIPGATPTPAGATTNFVGGVAVSYIVFQAMKWALSILAAIGIVGFIGAGILYLLSGGDDTRMKTAKNAMVAAIIGVVVGIMGLVIMYAARNFLMGSANF